MDGSTPCRAIPFEADELLNNNNNRKNNTMTTIELNNAITAQIIPAFTAIHRKELTIQAIILRLWAKAKEAGITAADFREAVLAISTNPESFDDGMIFDAKWVRQVLVNSSDEFRVRAVRSDKGSKAEKEDGDKKPKTEEQQVAAMLAILSGMKSVSKASASTLAKAIQAKLI